MAGIVVSMGSLLFAQEPLAALRDALLGAFVVAGTILVLVLLFEKIKGVEAMGGGDIKLLFMTGTFLGLAANIVCLLLSCLIGIFWGLAATVGKEEKTFPWGPSIAIGAMACPAVWKRACGMVSRFIGLAQSLHSACRKEKGKTFWENSVSALISGSPRSRWCS